MSSSFRLLPVIVILLISLCIACGDDPVAGVTVTCQVTCTSVVTNVVFRDGSGGMVTVNPAAKAWTNEFRTTAQPLALECTATTYGTFGIWMPGGDPMGPGIWLPMMDTMTVTISVDGSTVASNTATGTDCVITCTTNHLLP